MNTQTKITGLSFVQTSPKKATTTYWPTQKNGNFSSGLIVGENMAHEYLEFIKVNKGVPPIFASMIIELTSSPICSKEQQGQIIGFFGTIENVLKKTHK